MLATETFAKLCSIYMVMDALVSSRQTSITSGSGLPHARPRHGQQQAQPRIRVDLWSMATISSQDSYCSSDAFHEQFITW